MAVFVIADLHLDTVTYEKSMEVFGNRWQGYIEKIKNNWTRVVEQNDAVIIPGDISWALTTEDALEDIRWIDALPGRKLIMKGNHDFWWSTMAKLTEFVNKNEFSTISFLHNNAFIVEDCILCGTRGWFPDETNSNIPKQTDYEKLVAREATRLKLSIEEGLRLSADREREILAFFHFPLYWGGSEIRPFVDILHEYKVKRCYFGHIHGSYNVPSKECFEDIEFNFVSADFLNFIPKIISTY